MSDQWVFPGFEARFEDPDMFFVKVTAEKHIDLESIQGLYGLTPHLSSKGRFIYWMMDMGTGAMPTREARAAMPRMNNSTDPFAMVIYGGSFASRTATLLLLRGLSLLGQIKGETTVAKSEQEARDWVARHRAKSPGSG